MTEGPNGGTGASPNFPPFRWSGRAEEAALCVAEDRLTETEIAGKAGITRRQLWTWRQHPDFAARVDALRTELRAAIKRRGIATKQARVDALNDRWARMVTVIDERAVDPDHTKAPGGSTGLLVHRMKSLGSGPGQMIVDEYEVDTGLLGEMRQTEKQVAIEMGEWQERPDAPEVQGTINVVFKDGNVVDDGGEADAVNL